MRRALPAGLPTALFATLALLACGENDTTETTTGGRDTSERDTADRDTTEDNTAAADTSGDVAGDAAADATPDGAPDAGPETTPDVAPDVEADAGAPGELAQGPCGGTDGECPAGLDCVATGENGAGYCQLPCNEDTSCDDVRGSRAICALGIAGEPEPSYCVPLCATDADCAAGHSCDPVTAALNVCAP